MAKKTNYEEKLAKNLKTLMARHGYSQQSLFRASGVSQGKIGYILRQEQTASIHVIGRLAEVFGIEPWQLLAPAELLDRADVPEIQEMLQLMLAATVEQRREILARARQVLNGTAAG